MSAPQQPILLTIAGFDPSSGAGVTADLAVFAAHGYFGTSAITALTVQSTVGVRRVQVVDADLLTETLACLEEDLAPAGIKIGMLADAPQVEVVADYLSRLQAKGRTPRVVLDTVLRSSSDRELLTGSGLHGMLSRLLPMVEVVTPNTEELSMLTGLPTASAEEIEAATLAFANRYPGLSVLATGGHRPEPDDILLHGKAFTILRGTRVETAATHGTGCALSSAVLCGLVNGQSLQVAAANAKRYVGRAMRTAQPHGAGKGPMNLLWPLSGQSPD